MAERPLITWPDLLAVLRDDLRSLRGESFEDWVERETFERDALVSITRFLAETWATSGERVEALVLMAFTSGWSAHRELRGERE